MKLPLFQVDAFTNKSFSGNPAAAAYIKPLLEDEDENVREVARESLE